MLTNQPVAPNGVTAYLPGWLPALTESVVLSAQWMRSSEARRAPWPVRAAVEDRLRSDARDLIALGTQRAPA